MKSEGASKIAGRGRRGLSLPGTSIRRMRILPLVIVALFAAGTGLIQTALMHPAGQQQDTRSSAVRTKRAPANRNARQDKSGPAGAGTSSTVESPQDSSPVLATVDFNLVGLAVTASPSTQTVPKNTPTVVNTSVQAPPGTDPNVIISQLNPNYRVLGDLSGPSLSAPLTLEAAIGQPLQIPALSRSGDHVLQNLRVVDTGATGSPVIASVTPDSVGIVVIDQLLVSQVQVSPLSYDQITQLGINITDDSYHYFNFVLGVVTTSGVVPVSVPVAMPDGSVPNALPVVGRTQITATPGTTVPPFTVAPVMMSLTDATGNALPPQSDGSGGTLTIPGVVVFPGRIGFLHQFFQAIVIVGNGAPSGTPLIIHDLSATVVLPDNGTPNDPTDDPLRIAATQAGGVVTTLPLHGLGPDGQYGTADDTLTFSPGQSGQAPFLLEGLKEGLWNIDFNLKGTLDGLPIGPVTVTGTIPGAVLVRDPAFSVTFMHPGVVRAGQQYELAMTLNNTGTTDIQGAVVHLAQNSISGAELLPGDNGDRAFVTDIPAKQSATVVWKLKADTTGAVTASYVKVGDGVQAGLILTTGVGDRNVPLSPDSLLLPDETRFLPPPVVDAARQLLGQAWGVANAPPGGLPAGVTPISRDEVLSRAQDLGIAGMRVEFGEPVQVSLATLVRDWLGESENVPDPGFADAIRNTVAGYNWYDTVGAEFAGLMAGPPPITPVQLHQQIESAESPRSQFISALVTQANGPAIFGAAITDPSGNSVGDHTSATDRSGDIVLGASMRLNTSDQRANPVTRMGQLLLVSRPAPGIYTLAINGWANGTADISLMIPVSGTSYRQVVFSGVQIAAGGQYRITFTASGSQSLTLESLVSGAYQPVSATPSLTSLNEPAPQVEGVMQVTPDVLTGGDKYGRLVGILFSKSMSQPAAETASHYQITGGTVTGSGSTAQVGGQVNALHARLNFGRLVVISLDTTIGPFIDRSVTISGLTDPHGVGLVSAPVTSPITMTVSNQQDSPGGYLTGHVLLADGTPVTGVQVTYWTQPCEAQEPQPIARATTDSQGGYEIDYVRNGDCGPVVVTATNTTNGSLKRLATPVIYNGQHLLIDLVFLARGSVAGTVTIGGVPAPNAFVQVTPALDRVNFKTVQADGAGHYQVSDVAVGPVGVFAEGAGAQNNATGIASGNVPGPGQTATVDVSLQSLAGVVKGTVVHFDQSPSAGSLVVAYFQFPNVTQQLPVAFTYTDRTGAFSISNLPVGNIFIATEDAVTAVQVGTNVQLTSAQPEADGVVLTLPGNGSVSGTVTDDAGSFVSGAQVKAAGSAVGADPFGNYTLTNLPAGIAVITATDPKSGLSGSAQVTVVLGQTVTNVKIVISRPSSLNGHVYIADASGNKTPVQLATVSADGINQVQTDGTGAYSLSNVGGSVLLRAVHPNQILGVNLAVTLLPGEVLTRDLVFHSASIHGTVRQPDGTPAVATLSIVAPRPKLDAGPDYGTMSSDPQNPVLGQSAADGTYKVPVMNTGTYSVTASNAFLPTAVSKGGTLISGDDQQCDLTLVSTLAGKIQGTVFQPDGVTPVGAGTNVTIGGGQLADVTVRTDQNGHYEFAQVFASGAYTLTATDPVSGLTNRQSISAVANQDLMTNIRLLGLGSLTVTVVDGAGNPVQTGSINVDGASYPNAHRFTDIAVNGGNVAQFGGLVEGQYAVTASQTGVAGRTSVTIAPGGSVSVTLTLQGSGSITGHVFMPDGKTAVGLADVQLVANGRVIGVTETSNDDSTLGSYTFADVPVGSFTLSVLDNRTGRVGVAFGNLTAQGQTVTTDVLLIAQGTITGTVTSNGAPVDHALVSLSANGSGIAGISLAANTDPNGNYRFDGVPQGTFNITASNAGLTGSASGVLSGTTDPLPPVVANIALQPSCTVTGVVFDTDGSTPIAGARVTMDGFSGTTTPSGSYTFVNVPLGTHIVSATAPVGYSRGQSQPVTASQAGATVTINVTLTGTGTVGGDALDNTGAKLTSGTITYTNTAFGGQIVLIAPVQTTGRYQLPGVPAGNFSIQLTVPNRVEAGSATGTIVNGQTLELPLTLADAGTITGSVVEPDGRTPAVSADVTLTQVETAGPVITMLAHTNTQGGFTFANVPLGTGSIAVSDPNSGGLAVKSAIQLSTNGQTAAVGALLLDTTPIAVASVSPANGSTNVAKSIVVTINFSEAALASTVNAGTVRLLQAGSPVPSALALSTDGTVATLTPSSPLADGTVFTIDVTTGLTDLVGHALTNEFTASFTTVDTTPPVVVSVTPANNATQVPLSGTASVTFNKQLDPAQNFNTVFALAVGAAPGTPVPGTAALDSTGKVLTFTPTGLLTESAQYTVTVTGVRDLSGNVQAIPFVSGFVSVDLTPPVVDPLPIDGTSPATLTPTITATYHDNLSGVNPALVILMLDGVNVTASASVGSAGLTFTPSAPLAKGSHTVTVQVSDFAGNVSTPRNATFTLSNTAPIISSFTIGGQPAVDGMVVASSLQPAFTAVYSATGSPIDTTQTRLLFGPAGTTPAQVAAAVTSTGLSFTPAAQLAEGAYVTQLIVVDALGNTSTSGPINFTLNVTSPLVQTVTPNTGSQHGGTAVTLTGLRLTNLNGTAPSVMIGGNTATVTGATPGTGGAPDQVTLVTPAGAPGPATIEVANDHGAGSLAAGFTYTADSKTPFAVEADTVLLWHLDELGNGAVPLVDSGPFHITGTAGANSLAEDGRFAGGRASANLASSPNPTPLAFGNSSFTVECWVKTNPVTDTFALVDKPQASAGPGDFLITLDPTGQLSTTIEDRIGTLATTSMPSSVYRVDDNQWHSVAMVADRTAGQLLLYVDGVQRASSSITAGFTTLGNFLGAVRAGHGASPGAPAEFPGVLDEIRASSSAHSAQLIQEEYLGTAGGLGLVVTASAPLTLPRGITTEIELTGYNLAGLAATMVDSAGAPVPVSVVATADTKASLQAAVSAATALGNAHLSLSTGSGTATLTIEVVDLSRMVGEAEADTVLLWHLDELGNGAVPLVDSGPFHITGTAGANSVAEDGRFAGGRASANLASSPNPTPLAFGNSSFTVECWVKTNPVTSTYALVDKPQGSAGPGDFLITLDPSGQLSTTLEDRVGTLATTSMPSSVYRVDDNQWHSVAMVADRTAGQLLIYVDGVQRASSSITAGFTTLGNFLGAVRAGHAESGVPVEFPGVLDEIKISNTAHSAQRIAGDFNGTNGLTVTSFGPSLIVRGKPSQAPGTTEITVNGYGLDNITAQVVRNSQTIGVVTTVAGLSYRQAIINAVCPATVAAGPAQLVISSAGQPDAVLPVQIVDQTPMAVRADTVLLWHLDEASNGPVSITDSGPLSIGGTAGANSIATDGRFTSGPAGTGGRANASIVANPDFGALAFGRSSFTLECWVKTGPVNGTYALLDKPQGSTGAGDFLVTLDPAGQVNATIEDPTGALVTASMPPAVYHVDDNQWHSVAMTVDRSAGQLTLYVDGAQRASAAIPPAFAALGNFLGPLRAGHGESGSAPDFPGVLDEIRISNTAHSAAQVASDFVGYDVPTVAVIAPSIVQSGAAPSPFTVDGNGLFGCTITPNQAGVSVSNVVASDTQIQFLASAAGSVSLGPVSFTITDPLGHTAQAQITVVNQQPFPNADSGTVLMWHLDEPGNGAVAITDSGPSAINGTAGANSTAAQGRFTAGAPGTGGRQGADIATAANPPALAFGGSSFTLEFWVKTNPVPTSYALVDKPQGNVGPGDFLVTLDPGGQLNGRLEDPTGALVTATLPSRLYDSNGQAHFFEIDDGQWHLVELVTDRTAGQLSLYVDGALAANSTIPSTFGGTGNFGGAFRAGHHEGAGGVPTEFPGVLDEIRVLNVALTPAQIHDTWFGTAPVGANRVNPKLGGGSVAPVVAALPEDSAPRRSGAGASGGTARSLSKSKPVGEAEASSPPGSKPGGEPKGGSAPDPAPVTNSGEAARTGGGKR